MKYFINILIVLSIVFTLSSCKKNQIGYHKITYELEFLDNGKAGFSNFIDASTMPSDEHIILDRFNIPKKVINEYYGLKRGDKVYFSVDAQTGYWFIMRILIDDKFVSEREVKIGYGSYYVPEYYKQTGLNEFTGDYALIQFIY